jgi:hypothetical protein
MEAKKPMEPISPLEAVPAPSRVEGQGGVAGLAGLAIAGMLSTRGAASAFTASPDASSSGIPRQWGIT